MNSVKSILGSFFLDFLQIVVVALSLFIIVYIFVISPHIVVGVSMEPNFLNGEYVLTDNLSYKFSNPQRGDVIVLQYDPTDEFIKRVIGLPGDKVSLSGGNVYINGKLLNESAYIQPDKNPTLNLTTQGGTFLQEGETKTVPSGEYFVLGDHRGDSNDSRYIGWISKNAILGRVFLIYYPFNKFSFVSKVSYTTQGNTIYSKLK